MTDVATLSDALHQRVRRFAAGDGESFEALAIDIARFQADHSPRYRRLVEVHRSNLESVDALPAVPADAFRLCRVAVHPAEADAARFKTSGTTTDSPGLHCMRTTETYRDLSLKWGRTALASAWQGRRVVVALAPPPGDPETSSLGFMMRHFMEALDGRSLVLDPSRARFDPRSPERWLLGSAGVDVAGLRRAALVARERQEPLLVLATSFALVYLLDALGGATIPAPTRTVVMQTGGFKGRSRKVSPAKLRRAVARAFRIHPRRVVGEYGMTELTSQLYEGTLDGGHLKGPPGTYLEPPWLRITPVHPATLRPVSDGDEGLARIVDLGNVDSAVAVLTEDVVRRTAGGIELRGRRPRAAQRGCSLATELVLTGYAAA